MTSIDFLTLRNELAVFLRSQDVLSTSVRGVTRTTSNYTVGVGGEATHTFTGKIPARDFYALTVNGTPKSYLWDYTMNWNTSVLTWNSALIQGDVVNYSIDWGGSEKIWGDYPRDTITLEALPRIGIELTSTKTEPFGIGGMTHISDILLTVVVWVPANTDVNVAGGFGGINDLQTTLGTIRDKFRQYAKSFYSFKYITPAGQGPIMPGMNNKILQQTDDLVIKFLVET